MLVLSREPGSSILVESQGKTSLVTVLQLLPDHGAVTILVNRASSANPGRLESRKVQLNVDAALGIGAGGEVTLIDLRGDKARLGINAPRESRVHRLEVFEAIRRENRGRDAEDGLAGSPVPRPPSPPSLDVRLDEPRSDAGDAA